MEETILNKLKEEHQEIQTMLLKIQRCKGQDKKQEYFEELKKILFPHMEGEEQTLYTHLREDAQNEDALEIANLARYEHQEIRDMLEMLEESELGGPEWSELFSELQENIQSHFEEEETELFTEAKEDFSREELMQFADEFEEAKSHASYH